MPGYDGTGPKGGGPMTGGSRGYCLLKFSGAPNEPLTGFAGLSGYPVRFRSREFEAELESLQAHIRRVKAAVRSLQSRVTALEAEPSMTGKERR